MKFDDSKLLILLLSGILGFLLASQVTLGKVVPREILTFENYQQVSSEIRKLTDEINALNDKKKEIELELLKYKNSDQSYSQTVDKLTAELNKYDLQIGLTDVEGPGVVVTLNDNPITGGFNAPVEVTEATLVHDGNIMGVVWDLKNAGAEAISVNGHRVIFNTEFVCEGPVISVNDTPLAPPYAIKAIGDPESLAFALNNKNSEYKKMDGIGLMVNFRKENSIKIEKYSDGYLGYSYAKTAQENN